MSMSSRRTSIASLRQSSWAAAVPGHATRSFTIGAVHQAYSMVTTEGLAVDADGRPVDLTVRSFGVTPARSFPHVRVDLAASSAAPVACGTAVFAATLAAVWLAEGAGPRWPTRR